MQGICYLSAGLSAGLAFVLYNFSFTMEQRKFALALAGLAMCSAANGSMMGVLDVLRSR